jgi:hypothetical protein
VNAEDDSGDIPDLSEDYIGPAWSVWEEEMRAHWGRLNRVTALPPAPSFRRAYQMAGITTMAVSSGISCGLFLWSVMLKDDILVIILLGLMTVLCAAVGAVMCFRR